MSSGPQTAVLTSIILTLGRTTLIEHNYATLMARLRRAGFKADFVRKALLPDWWAPALERDLTILPDLELRIARFLGLSVEYVRDPALSLTTPRYAGARLRRVRNVDPARMNAAVHAGLQVAAATVRCLRDPKRSPQLPPAAPEVWHQELLASRRACDLSSLAADLWQRGVPVVAVDLLPAPKYQGLACIVSDRPVVLLGHMNDEPARLAVHVAHEVGHHVHGDCTPDAPVIDEEESVPDVSEMDSRADDFAWKSLFGDRALPGPIGADYRDWATRAAELEAEQRVDAGAMIWFWANSAADFQTGQQALKALYRAQGGLRTLRREFDRHVDLSGASETDRALLRCVALDPDRDAAPD